MARANCVGCAAYLGGGQCRDNLEHECAAGGGYEAYRPAPRAAFASLAEAAEYAEAMRLPEGGFRLTRRPDGCYRLEVDP